MSLLKEMQKQEKETSEYNKSESNIDNHPREILEINTGFKCNNNCIFCADGERKGKIKTDREIIADLMKYKGLGKVMFVYGEPTMNAHLPAFIRLAKKLGYKTIALSTNGRALSSAEYLNDILSGGLTEICISFHSIDKKIHESLTRTPGSYEQARKAIEKIAEAKKKWKFDFFVATTVTRINLGTLKDTVSFLNDFSPDRHILNFVEPRGNAENNYKTLVPKYADYSKAVKSIIEKFPNFKLTVTEIPFCVGKGIVNNLGIKEIQFFESGEKINVRSFSDYLTHIDECELCIKKKSCKGIFKRYIEIYGESEFRAIK
jgi:MoaA/NifB/PqqE/SkfB family radical SAM enzyme